MSSAKARNFRRRADDDDNNDDTNNNDVPSTTTTSAATTKPSSKPSSTATKPSSKPSTAIKPKKSLNQAQKLLSFADDEEGDGETPSSRSSSKPTSRSSKSSSSHKLTAVKDRLANSSFSASSSLPSNVQPQVGMYTKEALRELQKNTRTLASSRPASDSKPSSEPIVVLKGLVKPTDQISETVRQACELDSEDEDGEEGKEKRDAQLRFASMGIGKTKDSSGSLIPDQAMINAIRAKRERLRKSGLAAPDFISLDAGSNHGEAEGLSDEEPEFRGRIALLGDKTDGAKKGVFEEVDDSAMGLGTKKEIIENDEDEDEVEKIWEEAQFRKGLGKLVDNGATRAVNTGVSVAQSLSTSQQNSIYPAVAGYGPAVGQSVPAVGPSMGGAIGLSQGLGLMSISQQAEIAKKALQENVRRAKESHDRSVSLLAKVDENLSTSLLSISELEKSFTVAGDKYRFMQKLRHFVSLICDFLQDKAPIIEQLEEEIQKHHEKRASAILERRAADNDYEMMEVEAGVHAAMSIFNRRGRDSDVIVAAKSAAEAAFAALREETNLPVKLDEFGRDTNLQKRMEMKARAEARQRKQAKLKSKRLSFMEVNGSHCRVEGESSTDESDSESTAYQSHHELLLQTAGEIFSDAAEEYSQLSLVKERFEECKRDFLSAYRDAYMELSIPHIFSPYVKLELLKWDPLHEKTEFFSMNWHSLLEDYGLPLNGSGFTPDDVDANLVPELVEKVALPILHHRISHCWDMLSTRETQNVVAATSSVTDYVLGFNEEKIKVLLETVRTRLADAIANLTVPTWSPLVLQAVPNAARVAAYRFGVSVRLIKNICLWKDILALPVLEKLVIDELLCGKILPHVRSIATNIHDAITRTERIVASLSGVWAGPRSIVNQSRSLQPLVDYVLLLGKVLEKKHTLAVTESETAGLARRLRKILTDINEYDTARDLARTFNLRDAL